MLFEDRCELGLYHIARDDVVERTLGQHPDDLLDESRVFFALDHLHQLECRRPQFDTLCRRFVQRAVDDVCPVDEFGERLVLEAELLLSDTSDKFGAGLTGRIEKLSARCVGPKMLLVRLGQKCRLMMIEPPCEAFVGTVFEIDDGVFVAVKLIAVKGVAGPVHRGCVGDQCVRVKLCLVKLGEDSGR